jgi:hypothetical protein
MAKETQPQSKQAETVHRNLSLNYTTIASRASYPCPRGRLSASGLDATGQIPLKFDDRFSRKIVE